MGNLLLQNRTPNAGSKIYFAKVTRFNVSTSTADVVTIDNNISLLNCLIACAMPAGFNFGTMYTPCFNDSNLETGYVHSPGDIYCIATFVDNDYNQAVILGFLFPKETTLSIPDYGLFIFRHESDVMWMIRGDGTVQVYHPSGSIIKMGSDDNNELSDSNMIPTKADGFHVKDAAEYNKNKSSNLFINWYKGQKVKLDSEGNIIATTENSAGIVQTTLTMTPDGNVTVTAKNDVTVNAENNATVTAGNNISATATASMFLTATSNDIFVQALLGGVYVHADQIVAIADVMAEVNSPLVTVNSASLNLNVPCPAVGPGTMTINGVLADTGTHSHAGGSTIKTINGIVVQI